MLGALAHLVIGLAEMAFALVAFAIFGGRK